jgi:hypothetical protein
LEEVESTLTGADRGASNFRCGGGGVEKKSCAEPPRKYKSFTFGIFVLDSAFAKVRNYKDALAAIFFLR